MIRNKEISNKRESKITKIDTKSDDKEASNKIKNLGGKIHNASH